MNTHPFVTDVKRRAALVLGGWLAALALGGCASVAPKSPEEQVTERAEAHWKALIAGDFAND